MRVRSESSERLGHGHLKERPPADPFQPLRHLLPHSSGITDGDLSEFVSTCVLHRVPKGRVVGMASGAVIGVVAAGCLRVHFSDVDGSDRVLYFVPEGWCLAGVDPSATERSNDLRVDALEPSEVWLVPDAAASRRVERVWNALAHSTLLKIQRRLVGALHKDAAQRYVDFRTLYPGLERRIAQYHIAAYIGVSPEFFSKLRKRVLRTLVNSLPVLVCWYGSFLNLLQ
jgi:CRP/FNR family transcriptional regulator, anaerobic regulatory protein